MDYVINNFIKPGYERSLGVWRHRGFQKYFKNTGWMFGGNFITLAIGFLVGAYVARYLGPSNYGLLNYAISFVLIFGFIPNLGTNAILNRELVKDPAKKDELLGTSLYLRLFGAVLAIAVIFIVSIYTTSDKLTLILIWLFSLNFIPNAFGILDVYFNSQVLSKRVVVSQIITTIISSLLKILLVYFDKGIFWLTVIFVIDTVILMSLLIFNYKKIGNKLSKWKFNSGIAKSLLRDSWPLIFTGLAMGIYMRIDQVMIKNFLGNEAVGLYAVAVKFSEIWYIIPGIITTSIFPAIVKAHKKSNEDLENKMSKLYFLLFWGAVAIALSMTILAGPIIKILFGSAYLGSIIVLQIHVWAGIAIFIVRASNKFLMTSNLTKIIFYNTLLGAISNITLNIILIPQYGIIGAAIATIVSYFIATFGIVFFKKTRGHFVLILKSVVGFNDFFRKKI